MSCLPGPRAVPSALSPLGSDPRYPCPGIARPNGAQSVLALRWYCCLVSLPMSHVPPCVLPTPTSCAYVSMTLPVSMCCLCSSCSARLPGSMPRTCVPAGPWDACPEPSCTRVPAGKVKKELEPEDGPLPLDETAKLLQELQEAQAERGGSRPSSNLSSLSNTSEREHHGLGMSPSSSPSPLSTPALP